MEFKATNHLRAEADEAWIALVMGGYFHNSNRCDLPTRTLRIYFTPFDSYELREGTTDRGHVVNLVGFDGSRCPEPQGWNRFSNQYCIGYQVRDLRSFVWRAEYRKHRFEIRAQRIDNSRWTVEYCSDCENSAHRFEMVEYEGLLKDWFQMIDPDTFEITTATTIIALASVAGSASQVVRSAASRGNHTQMYSKLIALANAEGINDVNKCFGAHGDPVRAEVRKWWKMMMELPHEEDQPTSREDSYREDGEWKFHPVVHPWNLRHVDILFERYGKQLPTMICHGINTVPQAQLIEELVIIGRAVHQILGHPPTFSFRRYLFGHSERDVQQMLHQISEQLGWKMV